MNIMFFFKFTRALFILLAILFASNASAQNVRTIKASDVFPYWDKYIALPAATRDGFSLQYSLTLENHAPAVAYFVFQGQKTRLIMNANNIITNMPYSGFANTFVEMHGAGHGRLSLNLVPIITLANNIPIQSVQNALNDYREGIRISGAASLIAPRFNSILFKGVNSGYAIMPNGNRVPLVNTNDGVKYSANMHNLRGAVALNFPNAPNSAEFER